MNKAHVTDASNNLAYHGDFFADGVGGVVIEMREGLWLWLKV